MNRFRVAVHYEEAFNLEVDASDPWDAKSKAMMLLEDHATVTVGDRIKSVVCRAYYTEETEELAA
jgi:hypothetical protein